LKIRSRSGRVLPKNTKKWPKNEKDRKNQHMHL
jgi:hypothetical protein